MISLDTNVVVDLLGQKRPKVRERFAEAQALGRRLLLSSVALFELRFGAANSARPQENARALEALLAGGIDIVPFDSDDAAEAGAIRALLRRVGQEIGPYGILIAAQSRRRGVTLVTHNVTEFERVPGLLVVDWAV
ncbi:type II toxin-antitoxin system VapC family toxin [Roseiarcus sp.]|uniref:type II toxin-antitoxin system VapC family toxin n=1 Tax=Roseiarcus sp. TaxID=1969460 RepID=UPI003F9C50EC